MFKTVPVQEIILARQSKKFEIQQHQVHIYRRHYTMKNLREQVRELELSKAKGITTASSFTSTIN